MSGGGKRLSAHKPSRGYALLILIMGAAGCRSGGTLTPHDPGHNADPAIAGSPPATIEAGTRYSFAPLASDADADALMFSIRNKPAWAGFDPDTGELSGTPNEQHVGLANGIEISVTDGYATATLPAFSIDVVYAETRKVTLSWMPPAYKADGSALFDLAGFRIYYGHESGEFPFVIEIDNPGLTSFVVENLAPGTYYFATTAVDGSGAESSLSEIVEITI